MTRILGSLLIWCMSSALLAAPTPELVQELNSRVLRIQVGLKNGSYGLGSGVVVAENQIATNCHVVANASSITAVSNGATYQVVGVKPDWKHDVCMLQTEDLPLKPVALKSSRELKYEQPVFNIGYPSFVPVPVNSYGVVKGLFTMDDSVIVRATPTFKMGASGGGLFDESGALVGLITLKSPGRNAYYYYMSVDWVMALLEKPAGPVVAKSELPFWAKPAAEWPYFMKVVYPYLNQDWEGLKKVAGEWANKEPNNNEALFYLATAKYETHELAGAEQLLHKVIAGNNLHSQAFYYLSLIEANNGNRLQAEQDMAVVQSLDAEAGERLLVAIKGLP